MENPFGFLFVIIYCVGAGITTLMSISDGFDPQFLWSKDGEDAVCERRSGRKGVYLPPESAVSAFIVNMTIILFPLCTLN